MSTLLRLVMLVVLILVLALLVTPALNARPQTSAADLTLLNAANRDRAAAGLSALQWDNALAAAAHQHAVRMARANTLSHQLPGESPMQDRARHAGARFSMIAENVALGPSVPGLHTQWMNSAPHRANLLDPNLNAVGISVVQSGKTYFAVEDFSTAVVSLSLDEQERQVSAQLAARGLADVSATKDARKTCQLENGWAGQRPAAVMRFETPDLTHLPDDVWQKIASGKYHSATVGACEGGDSGDFTRYRVAILLF